METRARAASEVERGAGGGACDVLVDVMSEAELLCSGGDGERNEGDNNNDDDKNDDNHNNHNNNNTKRPNLISISGLMRSAPCAPPLPLQLGVLELH